MAIVIYYDVSYFEVNIYLKNYPEIEMFDICIYIM